MKRNFILPPWRSHSLLASQQLQEKGSGDDHKSGRLVPSSVWGGETESVAKFRNDGKVERNRAVKIQQLQQQNRGRDTFAGLIITPKISATCDDSPDERRQKYPEYK